MTKLHQVIALSAGKKSRSQKEITQVHHKLQKVDLLSGHSRHYEPKDEDGDRLPPEGSKVQYTVKEGLRVVRERMKDVWDVVSAVDQGNRDASAPIIIDGEMILSDVPAVTLLFLEKQLLDVKTIIEGLPVLDPGEEWEFDKNLDCYATGAVEKARTKKVPRNHIKYDATKEHPAQVEVWHEDVIAGTWTSRKFSGAIAAFDKTRMLERAYKMLEAVKTAREKANEQEVEKAESVGEAIFNYIEG